MAIPSRRREGELSPDGRRVLTFPNPDELTLSIRAKALVFHDEKSQALLEEVERVAPSEATVLIIGETGTGKELVARHIHEKSGRSGPFVAVNCGAFSETLVEAELFGHEAGAFTGANHARAGWFEAANGGTLFLDEVGDLPQAIQVKLLRVLQERCVVRIGARHPVPIDVRLVAATNVDLDKAVNAGHFRRDLYYRLNVAPVLLSPLRERPGDILHLVKHFIERYSRKLELEEVTLTEEAELALLDYEWPGNIRELENVVHYALIVCQGGRIGIEDLRLPKQGRGRSDESRTTEPSGHLIGSLERTLRLLLEKEQADLYELVEQTLVMTAFAFSKNNQVQTARRLGISRNILRAHLKRFGLLESNDREVLA